ncbi:MAG TPA: IS701 family transposase [Gemmatimonadales bacterium]|nr:IS701 family transposase [Gemmatimonadales bacterium]
MTADQVAALGPAFTEYLRCFQPCFVTKNTFAHLGTYCRGLLSDLARKSVEPIALAAGGAVRTLQEFLTHHVWDHDAMLAQIQRRIVAEHLPAPCDPSGTGDELGVVGLIDETSVAKKGDKTPGVQRQYCGASGKIDNCIVTVHLAVKHGPFLAMLDSDLFLPEASWDLDRKRCKKAHIPEEITYRSKWLIALEQIQRAVANGVRFDWLTFDEWYGGKPELLFLLEEMGMNYVCEVPKSFMCWPTMPKYNSLQAPFAAKRVENAATYGKPFRAQSWQTVQLARETLPPQTWKIKAAQVHLQRDGRPTDRTYWLIVARNLETGAVKYFLSNAPPKTALKTLLKVAFCRWNVEHAFRLTKTEIGLGHFEGRSWKGLLRHMILCQAVMLFVAEQTTRLRGEKSAADDGANGPRPQHRLPAVAEASAQVAGY